MILLLPFPDPSLLPNRAAGRHWTATRALKDAARDHAYVEARKALGGAVFAVAPGALVPLKLTFCAPDRRRRDLDGCLSSAKAALDGVARALEIDDSQFQPVTLERGPVGKPGAVIVEVGA